MSKDGRGYDIELRGNGVLSCSCPAYPRAKAKGQPCKHLTVFNAAGVLMARCHERHKGSGETLCRQCLVSLMSATMRKVRRLYKPKPPRKVRVRKGSQPAADGTGNAAL